VASSEAIKSIKVLNGLAKPAAGHCAESCRQLAKPLYTAAELALKPFVFCILKWYVNCLHMYGFVSGGSRVGSHPEPHKRGDLKCGYRVKF
jgi:hypothetical protein